MDHDRLFKELLTTFFMDFLRLLLPLLAACIDPDSIEFLDKEIFSDFPGGERHEVDLLVKARFIGSGEGFLLIHVENQGVAQPDFPERMFTYFADLFKKFRLPIYPVALFTFDRPLRPEADCYRVEFPGRRVLNFSFHTIQLNQLNWRDFLRTPNPVASALMTKMKIAPEDRPRVKLECLRMLANLKLDRARASLITTFMDAYLKLTAAETLAYNRELRAIEPKEREVVMKLTNEWIELGKSEGLKQGLETGLKKGLKKGRNEGQRQLLVRLLNRRIGGLPRSLSDQVNALPDTLLGDLGDALFDFNDIADAQTWLDQHR